MIKFINAQTVLLNVLLIIYVNLNKPFRIKHYYSYDLNDYIEIII